MKQTPTEAKLRQLYRDSDEVRELADALHARSVDPGAETSLQSIRKAVLRLGIEL